MHRSPTVTLPSEPILVPVVDLLAGQVVHARRGERSRYQPIQSPLCPGSDLLPLARALRRASGSALLYAADLDALQGEPVQAQHWRQLLLDQPDLRLWLDAGFASRAAVEALLAPLGKLAERIDPVLASEALPDTHTLADCLAADFGARSLLSLDRRAAATMDPAGCWQRSDLWPPRVIVMTLDRVGSDGGPDLATLADVASRSRATDRPALQALVGAGGLRDTRDLAAAGSAGATHWLVATALHEGRLGRGSN